MASFAYILIIIILFETENLTPKSNAIQLSQTKLFTEIPQI
jgi:hypothetical protein